MKMLGVAIAIAPFISSFAMANYQVQTTEPNRISFEFKKVADIPDFPKVVSESNQVIGFVDPNSTWPDLPDFSSRAMYRWSESKGVEWLITEDIISSDPKDINNNGDATAKVCDANSCYSAIWTNKGDIQSLQDEVDLPIQQFIEENELGSAQQMGQDNININENGQLVGTAVFPGPAGERATLAWRWDKKSGLEILENASENVISEATDNNNKGTVVGSSYSDEINNETATYWDKKGQKNQIILEQSDYPWGTLATAVNNSGLIAGVDRVSYASPWRYSISSQQRLPMEESTYGGTRTTHVLENDYIAGATSSNFPDGDDLFLRPVLWDSKGNIYDLNDEFNDPENYLAGWFGINTSLLMATPLRPKSGGYYEGAAVYQLVVVQK
ncbi:hypothetical protein L1D15_06170 [Vibrio sp. Isolate25]|uniref:hypothetical protein n=1 Tax=Vibrio sp. Isolate25 TaxID=2908535 RepID=UPI001EFD7530|nr:hypothetical protein [Vibrio sp. Isolate25]MCG9596312.1 hypothetical protein [Vibrio sp. Isolate25]